MDKRSSADYQFHIGNLLCEISFVNKPLPKFTSFFLRLIAVQPLWSDSMLLTSCTFMSS